MSRRPGPSRSLSQRDSALLSDVGRLRFATGQQLARLHFATGTEIGRQRRAQASLRRLVLDGYLDRLPRRVGGPGSGSARFIYRLGYRGQKQVWPGRRARTPDEAGIQFVDHALEIAELVVGLVEADRIDTCQALRIETEPEAWRHYVGGHGRPLVLKPDLAIDLQVVKQRLVWFIEVDRATEGLKRIRTKASQYLDYWRMGLEQARPDRHGAFPRVVWSVPDERRRLAIQQTLTRLPEPAGAMYAVVDKHRTVRALLGHQQATTESSEGGER